MTSGSVQAGKGSKLVTVLVYFSPALDPLNIAIMESDMITLNSKAGFGISLPRSIHLAARGRGTYSMFKPN